MISSTVLAVCLMCCVQVGFGGYSVVLAVYGKAGHIDPVVFSLCRDACAFPILLAAAALLEGVRWPRYRDLPLFLSMGLVGIFGNQVPFILGLYNAGADVASMWQPSTPVLTVVLALATCQERLPLLCGRPGADDQPSLSHSLVVKLSTMWRGGARAAAAGDDDGRTVLSGWLKVGGVALVCAGGIVMVKTAPHKSASKAHAVFLGEIMLLANCSCMAMYVLIQKRWIFQNDGPGSWKDKPINVTAWSYMFGASFMALASGIVATQNPKVFDLFPKSLPPCHPAADDNMTAVTASWCDAHSGNAYNTTVQDLCACDTVDYASFLIPLSYAAFISSSMAYGFITIANKYLPSTVVTAFWPMQVPAAVTLNWFVNAKTVTLGQGLGGCLIILALFMVCSADGIERKKMIPSSNSAALINEKTPLSRAPGDSDDGMYS